MGRGLLSRLSTYAPSSRLNPFENFMTETFVFLLEYSHERDNSFWRDVLEHIVGFRPCKADSLVISTQTTYRIPGKNTKPDISIVLNDLLYLVEVKVDSSLNLYWYRKKSVDQIELYKKIGNVQKIVILEKRFNPSSAIDDGCHVSWYRIGVIAKNSRNDDGPWNFLMDTFLELLEENGMTAERVGKAWGSGMLEVSRIMKVLRLALDESKCNYGHGTDPTAWFGYKLKTANKEVGWVGASLDNTSRLWIEISDENMVKKARKKKNGISSMEIDSAGEKAVSYFAIDEAFYELDGDGQKKAIQLWIDESFQDMGYGRYAK